MGVKVLSLFDGMACGMVAMKELGMQVDEYNAYEIDKYALKVAKSNFPIINELGDVFEADFAKHVGVDWLIGGSPCFAAGTMVYTDRGYKPIEQIKIGDMVLTHKNRFKPVIDIGHKIAPTVTTKVCGALPVVSTTSHPFYATEQCKKYKQETGGMVKALTEPHRVEVQDFDVGKTHLGINQIDTDVPSNFTNDELWLLGRYVADGHYQNYKRKDRENSWRKVIVISVGSNKIDSFEERTKHIPHHNYDHTQNVIRATFTNHTMRSVIENGDFGFSALTKKIPNWVINLPKEQLTEFLDGYFSGDGSYSKGGIVCTTVSKELALGLQLAILKVYGVNASISMPKIQEYKELEGRTVHQNPQYVISFHFQNADAIRGRLIDNQMWLPVTSVAHCAIDDVVYNITVDEDHSYTVNNLITFNCTYWSIAQSPDKRETTSSGMGWDLFCQYVRALKEAKPKIFLYENNKSMSKDIRKAICDTFGFEPFEINSALVSAQNRQRLYWVGIRQEDGTYRRANIDMPKDKGILLKDILETGEDDATETTDSN